jgi:hypothetical protein
MSLRAFQQLREAEKRAREETLGDSRGSPKRRSRKMRSPFNVFEVHHRSKRYAEAAATSSATSSSSVQVAFVFHKYCLHGSLHSCLDSWLSSPRRQ